MDGLDCGESCFFSFSFCQIKPFSLLPEWQSQNDFFCAIPFFRISLQRNRLLIIPWLINSMVSLLYNGGGIVLTVIVAMKLNAPDYSSIIPFTVAAVIVFGNYNLTLRYLELNALLSDRLIDWLVNWAWQNIYVVPFYSLPRHLHLCLHCNFVIVRGYSSQRTKQRIHQFNSKS